MLLESVYGVMFNSPKEHDLAIRDISITPKRHGVLGEGVHLNPTGHTTADGHDPYILYMGRLEGGKNLQPCSTNMYNGTGRKAAKSL